LYKYYQLGLSAQNPDTRNFSGKVSWNFKSFAQINRCVRREVLWLTFLRKKGKSVENSFVTFLIRKAGRTSFLDRCVLRKVERQKVCVSACVELFVFPEHGIYTAQRSGHCDIVIKIFLDILSAIF